jgi:hypothetical protein
VRLIQLPALAGSCRGAAGRAGALVLAAGALVVGTFAAGAFTAGALAAGARVAGAFAGERAVVGLMGWGTGFLAVGARAAGMGFLAGGLVDIVSGRFLALLCWCCKRCIVLPIVLYSRRGRGPSPPYQETWSCPVNAW